MLLLSVCVSQWEAYSANRCFDIDAVDVVVIIRILLKVTSYMDVVSIASRARSIVVLSRHLVRCHGFCR